MKSELGEHTRTFAKRKDSGETPIRRYQYFHILDDPAKLPNGNLTQTKPFEGGVIRSTGIPVPGTNDTFQITSEISLPLVDLVTSGTPGNRAVLWAILPNGSIWASEGSQPTQEGRHEVGFTLWRPMPPELLERARKKVEAISEIRKRQAQPLPPIRKDDLRKINYVIS